MFNFIKLENEQQFSHFNKRAFKFQQSIVDDPLTSMEKLTQLVLRLPPEHVYASSSKVDVTANLDTAHKEHKIACSLEHALNNLKDSDSFIMVRNPEIDEEYRQLFQSLQADLENMAKKLGTQITDSTLYLFITSPNGTTPYHVDRYSTFLMQLTGSKEVYTWEPWNKEQISDHELETFMAKTHKVAPSLKDGFLEKATKTEIHPGEGTHIPFLSPHWVKTGDQVSASVSIIFNTKETQKQSLALRFNELIHRRLGIHLNPVTGSRSSIDAIKSFLFRVLLKLTRGRT
ncbi:MAG: cupin-like domain-containing protein [Oleiphilus sp.]